MGVAEGVHTIVANATAARNPRSWRRNGREDVGQGRKPKTRK
jgi:hypothetical protein